MSECIKQIISWLLSLIPTTNIIVFNSFPDYTDNAYAMLRYLVINGFATKYKLYWLTNEKAKVCEVQEKIDEEGFQCKVVYKMSLMGLFYLLRSRYCFYTHGILESFKIVQHDNKMINMWHGMPLKRIGLLDNKGVGYMHNANLLLASGSLYQSVLAECFGIDRKIILPIGQPRCDLLFESTDFFEKNEINRNSYDKVGMWLPTYRKSTVGDVRSDGEYTPGKIAFLDEDGLSNLDGLLQSLNHLLIIKLHPMDVLQDYEFRSYSNILIIKQSQFSSQLYPLLGSCDYLLTDFSSVCIDFDLCKKPMGFVIDDYASYEDSRGFIFDNILDKLPGAIISDYEQLKAFLYNPVYKPSPLILNDFQDAKAAERLTAYLNL